MSRADYKTRPTSSLGLRQSSAAMNPSTSTSTWRSSTSRTTMTAVVGTDRGSSIAATVAEGNSYDSEDLDFDAYRKAKWPNSGTASSNGTDRASSALGMSGTGAYGSNESLTTNPYEPSRSRGLSASVINAHAPQGRLKAMLQSINTRSTTTGSHRTPGVPGGKTSAYSSISETPALSTTAPYLTDGAPASIAPPRHNTTQSAHPIDSSSASSSLTVVKPPPPPVANAQLGTQPGSPTSSSSSSNDDLSLLDMKDYHNGIAARKTYRELNARLDALRLAWREDPKNHHLTDYEFNEGAKQIDFEDEEERGLYRELREYVVRGQPLGPHWERAKAKLEVNGDIFGLDNLGESEDGIDDLARVGEKEESDFDRKYHDAVGEHVGDTIDPASTDAPKELPRPSRLHALNTDIPPTIGPLSTASSSSRHFLLESSPDSQPCHQLPVARPGLVHHATGSMPSINQHSSQSHYSSNSVPSYGSSSNPPPAVSSSQSPEADSDSDSSLPQGKFQSLALNDTLQIRHQQLHNKPSSATLPPDAIIYEPPAPKSIKRPKRVSPPSNTCGGAGGGLGSVAVKASLAATQMEKERYLAQAQQREASLVAQREREAAMQREKEVHLQAQREREAKVQREREQSLPQAQRKIVPVPKSRRLPTAAQQQQAQQQAQQQKLNRSTGSRRRVEDIGGSGAEDKRPRSRGREEREEEHDERVQAGFAARPKHQSHQSHPPRQQAQQRDMYIDKWQQEQFGINGYYGPYDQGSPQEGARQNTVRPGENAGRSTQAGLVRTSSAPSRSSMDPLETPLSLNGSMMSEGMPAPQRSGGHKGGTVVVINRHEYQVFEQIGKGGSSKVYRVVSVRDHRQYALKKVSINTLDDEAMRSYATEIQMLKRLSGNDCIVRLVDDELRGKVQGTLFLVMELGETDFAKLLVDRQGTPIHLPWITTYFKQMLDAVNVIHEERIVHSDLKPANFVLIKGVLKLIDFGIAKAIANDTTNIQRDSQIGTLNYMSPETMNAAPGDDRLKIGRPSDVWSLGCILYQMVYGAAPFAALNFQQKMIAIAREDHIIPFPEYSVPVVPKEKSETRQAVRLEDKKVKVPMELRNTMKLCLLREAKKRPTISQLLREPWINGYWSNAQQLADDEAVISKYNMGELINYCLRVHDPGWDESNPDNTQTVEGMINDIFPQLKALRPKDYIP